MLKDVFDSTPSYKELPKLPSVRRDISFVADATLKHSDIVSSIKRAKILNLKDYGVFDLYKGKGVPEGKKSMAYYFIFEDEQKTLTDTEVDDSFKKVYELLKRDFLVEIR